MKQATILVKVLDQIDGDTFNSLAGRIAFQKRIYLVQAAGFELGYKFSWNQYGPYSSSLAQDGTFLASNIQDVRRKAEALVLRSDVQKSLLALEEGIRVPNNSALSEEAWLETLASLHFLAASRSLPFEGGIPQDLLEDLKRIKPYLNEHEDGIRSAWEALSGLPRYEASQ